MNQALQPQIPNNCFGIHVEPNIYIQTEAKDQNDDRLEALKKALSKKLAIDPVRFKTINFAELGKDKLFKFIGCDLLTLPIWQEVTFM